MNERDGHEQISPDCSYTQLISMACDGAFIAETKGDMESAEELRRQEAFYREMRRETIRQDKEDAASIGRPYKSRRQFRAIFELNY